jgi:NAD(P)-dependent dehydrogenase (short-subunit alcohol dehydrogenase family)
MVLPGVGAYAASKAALNMLSAVARAEWGADGIAVSTVYPGITATEFHDVLRAGRLHPERRRFAGDPPEKVAGVILGLVESGEPEAFLVPASAPAR